MQQNLQNAEMWQEHQTFQKVRAEQTTHALRYRWQSHQCCPEDYTQNSVQALVLPDPNKQLQNTHRCQSMRCQLSSTSYKGHKSVKLGTSLKEEVL